MKINKIVRNKIFLSNEEIMDINLDIKTKYEPQMALFAPKKGLYFYEVILNNAKSYLNDKNIGEMKSE